MDHRRQEEVIKDVWKPSPRTIVIRTKHNEYTLTTRKAVDKHIGHMKGSGRVFTRGFCEEDCRHYLNGRRYRI